MQEIKSKIDLIIIFTLLFLSIISIILKLNLVLIVGLFTVLLFIMHFIYKDDRKLLYFTIWSTLLSNFFSMFISVISYFPYICYIILLIKIFEKKMIQRKKIKVDKYIINIAALIAIINTLALIYNGNRINILLLIFYFFKKFGYIIIYLFFINTNISHKDITTNLKLFIIFAFIQFPLIIIQFMTNSDRDDITGLFGGSGTGILLQYLIYIIIILLIYKDKVSKIKLLDATLIILSLMYCALAEVKIGFIVIPIIFICSLILERKFIKLIVGISILFTILNSIYGIFIKIYPDHDFINNNTFTKDYIQTAYGKNSVNRLGFMSILENTVLDTQEKRFFGTGFATANPSSIEVLEGEIARQYDYLNIHYFTLPYLVVENGIVGTILWISTYIYLLIINIYFYIRYKDKNSIIIILTIISNFIFIYYNSSIITSPSIILMTWFILAFLNDKKIKYST